MIGNHLPRQCGIATFTTDLSNAITAEYGVAVLSVVAVNDAQSSYAYPPRVRFQIAEGDVSSYRAAANFLNANNVDLVCLQHEYGIFGGKAGSHVLELLQRLTDGVRLAGELQPAVGISDPLGSIQDRLGHGQTSIVIRPARNWR